MVLIDTYLISIEFSIAPPPPCGRPVLGGRTFIILCIYILFHLYILSTSLSLYLIIMCILQIICLHYLPLSAVFWALRIHNQSPPLSISLPRTPSPSIFFLLFPFHLPLHLFPLTPSSTPPPCFSLSLPLFRS